MTHATDETEASRPEDRPVDYAAVGATRAADLLQYPPDGFEPFADELRLGSGAERFRTTREQLFSWAAQRQAGVSVTNVHVPAGDGYYGIHYDADGTPLERVRPSGEREFSEDGLPRVSAGATAQLDGAVGGRPLSGVFRVVFVVDEPQRAGFALGSIECADFSGEQSFLVEHRADDSVWITYRAISRPLGLGTRVVRPLHQRALQAISTDYLRAVSPAWSSQES